MRNGSCHDMGYGDILLFVLLEGFEVEQQSQLKATWVQTRSQVPLVLGRFADI